LLLLQAAIGSKLRYKRKTNNPSFPLSLKRGAVWCKYERDEMQPSIEAAKKIAKLVDTTVGYLLSETEQENLFKDPDMLNPTCS
jgi:transcriptional regulator with XRE-family HTH domain